MKFAPFQLDPTLPTDRAIPKSERYAQKFGEERFKQMEAAMKERGQAYGINFSYVRSLPFPTVHSRSRSGHTGRLRPADDLFAPSLGARIRKGGRAGPAQARRTLLLGLLRERAGAPVGQRRGRNI